MENAGLKSKTNNGIFTFLKNNVWVLCISLLHTCATFLYDGKLFSARKENAAVYILLKILLFIVLCVFWKWIIKLLSPAESVIKKITLYAIPCMLVLLAYFVLKHPGFFVSDELNIYNNIIVFRFPWFTYLTGTVYALSLMIIPCQMGIVIIKIILTALVCGYVVYRTVSYYQSQLGLIVYALFVLPPVLDNGIRVHRMHYYSLLFLFSITKMFFDYLEKKSVSRLELFLLFIGFSVLTIWRREGIYLIVFAPLIIIFIYKTFGFKRIVSMCLSFFIILAALYVPQYINQKNFSEESTHTYNQWFVNMCRLGLQKEDYPEEIEAIDKCLSIEAVDRINEELGDQNYCDAYIEWKEGYVGLKSHTPEEEQAYKDAIIKIIMKEPMLFLKTRIGLWHYMNSETESLVDMDYKLRTSTSFFYILNIPMVALLCGLILFIVKKKAGFAAICFGLLVNSGITLFFSPASYFKYYYHSYLIGWLLIILCVIQILLRIKKNKNKDKTQTQN